MVRKVARSVASNCRTTVMVLTHVEIVETLNNRRIENRKYVKAGSITKALIERVGRKQTQSSEEDKLKT